MEYDDFFHDYKTQDAVVRNIEILGEAAKLLTNKTKEKYPDRLSNAFIVVTEKQVRFARR